LKNCGVLRFPKNISSACVSATERVQLNASVSEWYCTQTLTRHSWIHYTDCWIVK